MLINSPKVCLWLLAQWLNTLLTHIDSGLSLFAQVLQKALPRLGDSMVVSSLWGFAVAGFFDGVLCTAGYRRISQLPVSKARPLLLLQLFQAATLTQVDKRWCTRL